MSTTKRLLAVAAVSAIGGLLFVAPASADPTKGETFELRCETLGHLTVNGVPGNGRWTPGLVDGSNVVLVPYSFDLHGSFVPSDGSPPQTFDELTVKKAPHNGRLDSCALHGEFTDPYGTATIDGTVLVSFTKG